MDERQKDTTTQERAASEQSVKDQDIPEGAVEIPVEIVTEEAPREESEAEQGNEKIGDEAQSEAAVGAGEKAPEEENAGEEEAKPSYEDLEKEAENLRSAMEALRKATEEEIRDIRLRNLAELENFKKRLNREHGEHLKYAAENVMKDLIPSLDNLELAITYGSRDEACKNLLQGVEMTQKLLLDACAKHGLERVGKEGDVFDPALHEAIGTQSREDLPNDSIACVMQGGYSLQGRLVRPAKVMVNKR